jgi:hypothetical protein
MVYFDIAAAMAFAAHLVFVRFIALPDDKYLGGRRWPQVTEDVTVGFNLGLNGVDLAAKQRGW